MSWSTIQGYLNEYMLGDLASIAGLIIALGGFAITIKNVLATKKAAELSALAVTKVRQDLKRMETVSDFSAVLSSMEDIKRLHRDQAWNLLPERYSILRRSLISIRSSDGSLSEEDKTLIQAAIAQLAELERAVDAQMQRKNENIDIAETNAILTKQIDRLNGVLFRLRQDIGEMQ